MKKKDNGATSVYSLETTPVASVVQKARAKVEAPLAFKELDLDTDKSRNSLI